MKHKKFLLMSQLVFLSALFWCVKKSVYLYKLAVERTDKKCYENLFDLSYEESLLEKLDVVQNDIWIEDTNHKEIFISSFDNLNLYGLVIEQSKYSDDWVIIVHGYNGFGIQMADSAKKFYEAGFNVILPDCRGHGKSQGNYIGMGWHDRLDILQSFSNVDKQVTRTKILQTAKQVMELSAANLPNVNYENKNASPAPGWSMGY